MMTSEDQSNRADEVRHGLNTLGGPEKKLFEHREQKVLERKDISNMMESIMGDEIRRYKNDM